MKTVTGIIFTLGFFLAMSIVSIGCAVSGGEVHFVSPDQLKTESPPIVPRSLTLTEHFHYGQPTGMSIPIFMFYPRKTIRDLKEQVFYSIPGFLSAFSASASSYDQIQFAVARDARGSETRWYHSKEGSSSPLIFLRDSLSKLEIEKKPGERESYSPLESMREVLRDISMREFAYGGPIWIHFIYFRDRDLGFDPEINSETNRRSSQTLKNQVADFERSKKMFLSEADQSPLSRFRYSIQILTHMDPTYTCVPSDRLAIQLLSLMKNLKFSTFEICRVLEPERERGGLWTQEVNQAMAAQDSRLILMKSPDLKTIEVRVRGELIPREETSWNALDNELLFFEKRAQQLKIGDEIEVKYVPKNQQ